MVLGFSKEEREEHKSERQLDKAAERLAKKKRAEARRKGLIDAAAKQGYKEGRSGKKGGLAGFLQGAAKTAGKHIEVGPRKGTGGSEFSLGFKEPRAGDFDLGLGGPRKKSKKSDPYADLGL